MPGKNNTQTAIHLNRTDAGGRYAQLIDVCCELRSEYGSAANALHKLAISSDEYQKIIKKLGTHRSRK